jgi:hypothetical protein
MSRPRASGRALIALSAILLYAGVSTARWVRPTAQWPARGGPVEISASERRFRALRPVLPVTGVVGYQGHPDPNGPADGVSPALLHFRRYLLAQYSLAPLLLVENTEHEFVIGNFDPGAEPPPPAGFERLGEFGDGLVLFRRTAP